MKHHQLISLLLSCVFGSSRFIQTSCPTRRRVWGRREFRHCQSWSSFTTKRLEFPLLLLWHFALPFRTNFTNLLSPSSWWSGLPVWASSIPFLHVGGLISASSTKPRRSASPSVWDRCSTQADLSWWETTNSYHPLCKIRRRGKACVCLETHFLLLCPQECKKTSTLDFSY